MKININVQCVERASERTCHSRRPCSLSGFDFFTATAIPTPTFDGANVFSSIHPLKTRPNPPSPNTVAGLKFLVALSSSEKLNIFKFGVTILPLAGKSTPSLLPSISFSGGSDAGISITTAAGSGRPASIVGLGPLPLSPPPARSDHPYHPFLSVNNKSDRYIQYTIELVTAKIKVKVYI